MADFATPGVVIGSYRVVRELGRGATGAAYEAVGVDDGHTVVLKVLLPSGPLDPSFRVLIEQEYTALESAHSPSILVPSEYGERNGRFVLVYPQFRAGSLDTLLRQRGSLTRSAALALCTHIARALHDAHGVGVVHGGVKPTNIFPSTRDGALVPLLADFGGAVRSTRWRLVDDAAKTADGFAAPEVLRGEPPTPSSDVYSLGCLLFAGLTGHSPYDGPAPEQPEAIPQIPVVDSLDVELNEVFAQALQPDPEHRFANAAEMGRRLTTLAAAKAQPLPGAMTAAPTLAPQPTVGPTAESTAAPTAGPTAESPGPVPDPAGTPAQRRRRGLALFAAVAATAVAIGVVSYVRAHNNTDDLPQAGPATGTGSASQKPLPKPTVRARAAYRAVDFDLKKAAGASGGTLQFDRGSGWQTIGADTLAVSTNMGGKRVCVRVRAVDGDRSSPAVRRCGVSRAPSLAMESVGACTIATTSYTHCYRLHLRGFASGTVQVRSAAPDSSGIVQHYTDPVEIGANGTGSDTARFGASRVQQVTVTAAGITKVFTIG